MGFLIWLPVVSVVKASFILQTAWGGGVGRGRKQKNHIYMSVLQMIKQRASRRRKQKNADDFLKIDTRFSKYY